MSFEAQMRIGSLEILLALAAFGVVVGRSRFGAAPRVPTDIRLELAFEGRILAVTLSEGRPPRIIGRSADADLSVNDPEVSRRHAALQVAGGVVYLTDAGSRNGTFLNGKRLAGEGIEVKAGDHIDVGNTRIEVVEEVPL